MERVQRYLTANRSRLALEANWEVFRFVVVDCESTGFDPRKDRLVSIAGVGVCKGEICLWDEFSVVLPVPFNTASVTVHGITREASSGGVEEPQAIGEFLEWLAGGVIVGHHVRHDLELVNNACRRHFSCSLRNVCLDTVEVLHAVRQSGGFAGMADPAGHSLDALCDWFRIVPHDRHTAPGDAFLTAQILLRLLKEAGKCGLWNLCDLGAWYADEHPREGR